MSGTDHHHSHSPHHSCSCTSGTPSVHQNLDELEFERSIFQAAIDNDVGKIEGKFARGPGFEVNATDNYGYTALHYAARNGNLEAAKALIRLGANVNLPTASLRATPLHRAVTGGKVEMVKYLLSMGADLGVKDVDGLTPKDRAKKEGKSGDLLKLLEQ